MTPADIEDRIADILAELRHGGPWDGQGTTERAALEAELADLRATLAYVDAYHDATQAARAELGR